MIAEFTLQEVEILYRAAITGGGGTRAAGPLF